MKWIAIAILGCSVAAVGQQCEAIATASYGGWQSHTTAPRDGTVIEMLETYGIAPTYGIFQWKRWAGGDYAFVDAVDANLSVVEDECLFWRPYRRPVVVYVDPTGGAQNKVAYWCSAAHEAYDKKRDACVPRR